MHKATTVIFVRICDEITKSEKYSKKSPSAQNKAILVLPFTKNVHSVLILVIVGIATNYA